MDNTLRVLSRHSSHKVIRDKILLPHNVSGVLRLGSQTPDMKDFEINSVQSIKNCSDKLLMKNLFREHNITSPEFITIEVNNENYTDVNLNDALIFCVYNADKSYSHITVDELCDRYLSGNKQLLAKRSRRSRGIGMKKLSTRNEFITFFNRYILNNTLNLNNPYYLEVFHNYTKEYRVHVSYLGNEDSVHFYTGRKMLRTDTDAANKWFRNSKNCVWVTEYNNTFDKPDNWKDIVKACQEARVSLCLDITGIDVKVAKDGRFVILEANSACSFGDKGSLVATKYQTEITNIVANKIESVLISRANN